MTATATAKRKEPCPRNSHIVEIYLTVALVRADSIRLFLGRKEYVALALVT
jgi:hypothetical protein